MAERLQPGAKNDAADYISADIALRRGRMNAYNTDDFAWAVQRLQDRVSYSGWFFALISGLCMWAAMFKILI